MVALQKWMQINGRWVLWTCISLLVYALVFQLLYAQSGPPGALLAIPVFFIAWRWGSVAGLVCAISFSLINILQIVAVGLNPFQINGQIVGTLSLIIIGGVVGWISDLYNELKVLRDHLKAEVTRQAVALNMSEQLFAAFMEQVPALAFIKDEHGRLQYANSAMQQTFLTTDWQGKVAVEYLPTAFGELVMANDQAALRQGVLIEERQLPAPDGNLHTYRTHKFVIRHGSEPPLLGGLAIDITERKQMEDALSASEEKFRKAFDATPTAMGIQRVDNGHFLVVNDAFVNLTGYGREEMLGRNALDLNLWLDADERMVAVTTLRQQGVLQNYEFSFRRKSGEAGVGILAAEKIFIGDLACYLVSVQDITQRKQAELLLETYNRELERSNNELQNFAYVASHDLQEPLRKIQTFGSRLQTRYADVLDDSAQDYLARMIHAAARMQALIQDLLAYSRVTTRAEPFSQVDLNEVMAGVLSDLELQIQQSGGQLQVSHLPAIEADLMQMRQLMQNLLSNALKYHQPDQPPLVRIWAETINKDGRAYCQLCVADQGIGFEDKYAGQIFGIFQRLHGRDQYEGSGVGLAICKKIVERHGGMITAHSQVGQGATFVVTLPIGNRQSAHASRITDDGSASDFPHNPRLTSKAAASQTAKQITKQSPE